MQGTSANSDVQQQSQQVTRCTGSAVKQTTFGTAGFTADSFLNHCFLPMYEPANKLPVVKDLEKELFNSLSILENHYPMNLLDVSDKPFPYNVLLAYWDAERQLCKGERNMELFIIEDDDKNVKFATKETVFGGNTLFYIPVLPLYRLMEKRKDEKCADLLLSVCAYLYQVAQVPYYRDADSYLNYEYAIMEEWIEDDEDRMNDPDIIFNRSAIRSANWYGDIMHRRLNSKYNLEHLQQRVERFFPADEFGRDCLKVAQATVKLAKDHPDGFLFKHLSNDLAQAGGDDEEDEYYERVNNTLFLHQYVHFIAETEGSLYDSLFEMINSEFNEKQYSQEPDLYTIYDNTLQGNPDNLDYEHGLFKLINDLCTLLNQLP